MNDHREADLSLDPLKGINLSFNCIHCIPKSQDQNQRSSGINNCCSDKGAAETPKDNVKNDTIERVRSQIGVRSQIVLIYNPDSDRPSAILTSAVQRIKGRVRFKNEGEDPNNKAKSIYSLYINCERICEGSYSKKGRARKHLYYLAVGSLETTCFVIIRKTLPCDSPADLSVSENSVDTQSDGLKNGIGAKMDWSHRGLGVQSQGTTENVQPADHIKRKRFGSKKTWLCQSPRVLSFSEETQSAALKDGIGAKMMMKMGWSGGGLGAQSQGMTDIVQPTLRMKWQRIRKTKTSPCPRVKSDLSFSEETQSAALKDGIGGKMMMKMGWSGGGLGAQSQGITDIVKPPPQIKRQGFGSKVTLPIDKVRKKSDNINSISHSPIYTSDERCLIPIICNKTHLKLTRADIKKKLKSKYKTAADHWKVVQKQIDAWQLVYKLFELGGENEEYQLLAPTNFLNG